MEKFFSIGEAAKAAQQINGMEFIEQIRTYKLGLKTKICETLDDHRTSDNKNELCGNKEIDLVVEDRRDNLPCTTYRLFEVKHNQTED